MKNTQSVVIEKIVNGGLGLGRLQDGRVVLVDKALPAEEVRIKIWQEKKKFLYGEIVSVEKAHPERIHAPCPWYGQCGGCDLQHCTYDLQLRIKTAIVEDLFQRQFTQNPSEFPIPVRTTLASPAAFGYRQRIRLQVDRDGRLGFAKYHSHSLVPIQRCLVAHDELNMALENLQKDDDGTKLLAQCRAVELLFNPISSRVVCLFHLQRPPRPADIRQARDLAGRAAQIEAVFFTGDGFALTGPIGHDSEQSDFTLKMRLKFCPDKDRTLELGWEVMGFCQVNLEQNDRLIRHVRKLCDLKGRESVLDLFCGMGNFSIPVAMRAHSLVGVEGQGSAVRSAVRNSRAAGLTNTSFHKSPIHEACRELAGQNKVFDCLVVDPPRQGVPGLAGELAALTGHKMVYISCDPATLFRDLQALCQHGLTLVHIQPFDMFPQTHHIETVVVLEKN